MKIIFLTYTSKTYYGSKIKIDRPDLTRKMSCLETWVPRVEDLGHEVVFFDGNNDIVSFDEKNKILHLTSSDSYDYDYLRLNGEGSLMFERLKEAIQWCLNNREFDYIFRIDDGSYVNSFILDQILNQLQGFDVMRNHGGGAGIFLSKKVCEDLINYDNTSKVHIEDLALFKFFSEKGYRVHFNSLLCYQYVLGEEYFTIHYTNGKRQYFTDNVMSYYYTGTPIKRKVMINYPIYCFDAQKVNTWEYDDHNTPLYYSFDRDKYNWEHYGYMCRSAFSPTGECFFGTGGINELLLYNLQFDMQNPNEVRVFNKYINSVSDDGFIYFFYNSANDFIDTIKQHLEIVSTEDRINLDMEYKQDVSGIFLTTRKKI